MKFEVDLQDTTRQISVDAENQTFTLDDRQPESFELHDLGAGAKLLRLGRNAYRLDNIRIEEQMVRFTLNGNPVRLPVRDEQALLLQKMGFKSVTGSSAGKLTAPMPGKILEVKSNEGDEVKQGDPLVILEAMKMENELKAPVDGTVTTIHVEAGSSVEKNAVLIEIE